MKNVRPGTFFAQVKKYYKEDFKKSFFGKKECSRFCELARVVVYIYNFVPFFPLLSNQ